MTTHSRRPNPASFLIVILLMALTAVVTYYLVKNSEAQKQEEIVETKDKEILELREKMEDLARDLDAKIREAKKLGADYKALQEYKDQLEQDLSLLQKNADVSNAQLRQYYQKIQGYETALAAKDKELAELREQNQRLAEERDQLSNLSDSLSSETRNLSSTVSEVKENNQRLTQAAAVLKAENIGVRAYNQRDKQESRNAFRASRIDKLTIDFSLGENEIAAAGNRMIYMRLIEPAGTVVKGADGGNFEAEGQNMSFTNRKSVVYANTRTPVTIAFERPDDYKFKVGSHKVELYADGKLIGFKVFDIAK